MGQGPVVTWGANPELGLRQIQGPRARSGLLCCDPNREHERALGSAVSSAPCPPQASPSHMRARAQCPPPVPRPPGRAVRRLCSSWLLSAVLRISGGFWNDLDPYRISGFPYFSSLALKLNL